MIQFGQHIIKSYSSTQALITSSSGEAEFYGLVKAGSISMVLKSMLSDFGLTYGLELHIDASAAKGIGIHPLVEQETPQPRTPPKTRGHLVIFRHFFRIDTVSEFSENDICSKKIGTCSKNM